MSGPAALTPRPLTPAWWPPGVLVVTALAIFCRLRGLAEQSLWLDEYIWTTTAAREAGFIVRLSDGYPPLYGLVVHLLVAAGLGSDWWLRLPSCLAGAFSVPILCVLGARLDSHRVALTAGILLALNPLAVWYSQEIGAYAILMLVGLVASLLFARLLAAPSGRAVFTYALAVAIGVGTHYYFVFVVMAHALVGLHDAYEKPERRAAWGWVAACTAVSGSIWLTSLVRDLEFQTEAHPGEFSWLALPYTALTFVGGFSLGPPLRLLHPIQRGAGGTWAEIAPYAPSATIATLSLLALGALALSRRLDRGRAFVLVMATAPLLLAWIASFATGYRPRYALSSLPFALLWAAGAIDGRWRGAAASLVASVLFWQVLGLTHINAPDYARENNRAAAELVAREAAGDFRVLLVGETAEVFRRYAPGIERRRVVTLDGADATHAERLAALMTKVVDGADETWLVASRPWTADPQGSVQRSIAARLEKVSQASFAGVEVSRFRPRDGSSS